MRRRFFLVHSTALSIIFVLTLSVSTVRADFVRGDVNADGVLNIVDTISLLNYLQENAPIPCFDAADADDNGQLNVVDAVYTLAYFFAAGLAPGAPFPLCGMDPSADALDCADFIFCP